MTRVPELSPKDVGARVPVSRQLAPDTYTYDYIIVGGKHQQHIIFLFPHSYSNCSQVVRQDARWLHG